MRSYLALIKIDIKLALRDRSVIFFNYLFPLIFFFVFAEMMGAARGGGITNVVTMVLTIGILGNGLWGAGMRAVQEREMNILRRFKVTPISPSPILIASMVTGWLIYLPAVLLVCWLAHIVYGMPVPQRWASLLALVSLGVFAFRSIGMILASIVNSAQESTIGIQLLYMPMLFLSGATIPSAILPNWAQTLGEFLPASHLVKALQNIFFRNENLYQNRTAVGSLLLTIAVGLFLAVQLFRWEKEEKIQRRKKLWVLAVLAPFVVMGSYSAYTKEHLGDNEALFRQLQRSEILLIRNARVWTGDRTIETGAVLVRDGKVAEIYEGAAPEPEKLKAETVEGAGKTLLPGLIDAHVHVSAPGGISTNADDYSTDKTMPRAAAALLYSGVTSARSVGDGLDAALKLRDAIRKGAKLGAQISTCGPMFTAEGGHGTQYVENLPPSVKDSVKAQLVRTPKTPEEARKQVRDLKARGIDCVKTILEAGWGDGMLYDRLDLLIGRAVADEARAQHLPVATHTGDARDVADAIEIGAASIEHGSWRDEIPDRLLEKMAADGVYLDPTLGVAGAYAEFFAGRADALSNSLTQQVVSAGILKSTRDFVASGKGADAAKAELFQHALEQGRSNLLRAWKAGVPLVMGTDAGNPLVFHGASMHHELQLWVQAGIPAEVAMKAATVNAAKVLRVDNRTGAIRKGMDADLLLVDGNPLEDISATQRISLVVFQGERVRRAALFEKK
ncbi:MAG TPA: amidohydrolase family protein [Candidatus Solibacter sp.]|nr:amidohydrolase family protein [Candidatus Solibacter sp.]